MSHKVAARLDRAGYNDTPPFHPDMSYPELPFDEHSGDANHPYRLLRDLFNDLGMDSENYGQKHWNPLGNIVRPGNTVVLKPNFVKSVNMSGDDIFAVVTHPSILRALVDYTFIALKGEGRIIIADAPTMDCDWDELMKHQRLDTVQSFYREKFGFDIELYDLRNFAMIDLSLPAYSSNRKQLPGDPAGSVVINLGKQSRFYGLPSENYYGADYDRSVTIKHHQGETHQYCVSKTVLSADVFISVPKMKVHKKVGVTLNLKGLVGINTDKNYLIHYRLGTPKQGGDQLPDYSSRLRSFVATVQNWLSDRAMSRQSRVGDLAYRVALAIYRVAVEPFRPPSERGCASDAGNWFGNDSAWRMTADLAKIVYYADSSGNMCDKPQRKFFCVVDGIIGGENDGPLAATARRTGCLVGGEDPTAVDIITTRLMGFDAGKIKQFDHALDDGIPRETIVFCVNGQDADVDALLSAENQEHMLHYAPHPSWKGHVER